MELQGNVMIAAPRDRVWQALQDPDVLRRCIPGCEEVIRVSAEEMHARVMLKLGPVRAHFVGKVKMSDVRPGQGYTLAFEGSGGSAGFAKGRSVVTLSDASAGTNLSYTAEAAVAGKLGQIGGRLMDASARQLADRFFEALRSQLGDDQVIASSNAAQPATLPSMTTTRTTTHENSTTGGREPAGEWVRLLWFAAGSAATALGVWLGSHGMH